MEPDKVIGDDDLRKKYGMGFEKIKANLERLGTIAPDSQCVVLVLSGSFNPLHRMHIQSFEIARRSLEDRQHVVVGGFVAPSSNDHVWYKLGDWAMSLTHRNQMCEVAVQDSDWLEMCPWGNASAPRVCSAISKILEEHLPHVRWQVVEIFGADHALAVSCILGISLHVVFKMDAKGSFCLSW
eukprot:TRINITY_DN9409_c0_g1_i2.p1 TRINITY_DN9409_c0_g1~~TRINITY_DN9409_c0_g1_i2.p1  ORF type:complete len:201 (-),score=25.25 TRINITY_DN9409_c0_g1_i2:242-790(-)